MTTNWVYAPKDGSFHATLETDDFHVSLRTGSTTWGREDTKKVRVYVSGEEDVDFRAAYAESEKDTEHKRKVEGNDYAIAQRGDNPLTDKLFDRLNRQVVANQKAVVDEAKAAVPEVAEFLDNSKMYFSRTAGCSCGCSSGFVGPQLFVEIPMVSGISGKTYNERRYVTSIFITKRDHEAEAAAEARRIANLSFEI